MMYSNKEVETESNSPSHQHDGEEITYSALSMSNSIIPGGGMCHEVVEGDMLNSEDRDAFLGQQITPGGKQMTYSTTGVFSNNSDRGTKCFHGVHEGNVHDSGDSGFKEHDVFSQSSNVSGRYVEVYPAKSGSYDNVVYDSQIAKGCVHFQQEERTDSDEEALKEELLNIFEMYFKRKMDKRLQAFRSRQIEWEEASRMEKEELGNKMAKEKIEMQKHFDDAISKLMHSFNEEKKQLEQCYEKQLKYLRKKLGKYVQGEFEFREKLVGENHVMSMKETLDEKQESLLEKSEIKARFNKEKFELEKHFNFLLAQAEASLHRVRTELKESMRMEKEHQRKIIDLESKLQEEKQQRLVVERELEQGRAKLPKEESLTQKANEQLISTVEELRIEVEKKNSEMNRLLEANQESNLKIRALTRHLQKRVKRNSGESSVKSQEYEEAKESEGRAAAEVRSNSPKTSASDQQGNLAEVEACEVGSTEDTIVKVYDSKIRFIHERRKILVYVTFEKRAAEQGFHRFLNALLPKQPSSHTVRVLMTSDTKNEEVFSEH